MGSTTSMSHNQYRVCPPFAWPTTAHLCRTDITTLSVVTCGMLPTPPGGLYAVDYCSPEVDVGEELPDQRHPSVLLGTNPGNMPANEANGSCSQQETLCTFGGRVVWYCRAENWNSKKPIIGIVLTRKRYFAICDVNYCVCSIEILVVFH